jgi:predicted RNA-binding protein with PIN domain
MHLIIDGYNLLHVGRSMIPLNPIQLQWERERLIDQLSAYKKIKGWEITAVFDGWQGGRSAEKRERVKGIELIYSKLGEKADEVIKRLVQEKRSGVTVITSDRDVSRFAERIAVPVIPSDQFKEKMERVAFKVDKEIEQDEEGEGGAKKKGPSRRLSKREKRRREALRKL